MESFVESVPWNEKYWDVISNLFWSPKYLGLKSIPREKWEVADGRFSISLDEVEKKTDRVYWRERDFNELTNHLKTQEEILNHLFNFTFAITEDAIVEKLFCQPLKITDSGPFLSLGQRAANLRYGWGLNENVTQQDGLFISDISAIAIELKLKADSSPEQIAKYVALLASEIEIRKQPNLGLIFIIPEKALSGHWKRGGLDGPKINIEFLESIDWGKLTNIRIRKIFEEKKEHVAVVLKNLKLAVFTWTDFREAIIKIEQELYCSKLGGQTLYRLLSGFRAQLEAHEKTGIEPRLDRFTWTPRDIEIEKNKRGG